MKGGTPTRKGSAKNALIGIRESSPGTSRWGAFNQALKALIVYEVCRIGMARTHSGHDPTD